MSSLNERVFNLKACPLVLWVVLHIIRRLLSFKSVNLCTILNTIVMSLQIRRNSRLSVGDQSLPYNHDCNQVCSDNKDDG